MIRVEINNIDRSEAVNWSSLTITKNLTSLVDVGSFQILKVQDGYSPEINQEVEIYKDDDKIFGGYITGIKEDLSVVDGGYYLINFQDYIYELSGILIAKSFENKTGKEIIDELFVEFAPSFNTDNVVCNTVINKIVFNNAYLSDCLTRISKIIGYEWYIDQNKNVHFFQRFSLVAPFNLTDTNGNYVYKSLRRTIDATQIANQVKVRGGLGTETSMFEDVITVSGDETRTFKLPYKFANLQVWLDTGTGYVEQNVGIDNIDDFTTDDVLYNYQSDSIRFENSLDTGTLIKFAGNKKYPVMAIVSDDASIALIGLREKYIVDNSLIDAKTTRERAFLELDLAKEAITDCSFSTYQDGLETGMRITINSELRDISELDFIINKVVFKTRTPEDFEYAITCSTARKMGLTEFLKELAMRGDVFEEEDTAVAEIIKTVREDLEIDETIEKIGAYEINEELEIDETTQKNEFEPTWVLSPYVPTEFGSEAFADQINDSGNSNIGIYVNRWRGQSFVVSSGINSLAKLRLKLRKVGTPVGNFVVDLYLADGIGKPTGSVLAGASMLATGISTTATIYDFIFNTPISPSTRYVFVCKADSCPNSANCINVYYNGANPYTNGMYCVSTNNGVSWSQSAPTDIHFIEYSQFLGDVKRPGRLDLSMKLY